MRRSLPVVREKLEAQPEGSIFKDGSRAWIVTDDVHGRFTSTRRFGFALLIAIFAALPWISIGGHPAVFIDIEHRHFHLFGATFNAQDFWLVFFLVTAIGFALIVVTTLFGRVWCGYACPQTVWLEGVYRLVERFIEGPRAARIRRDAEPLGLDRVVRKTIKHVAFITISFVVAHVFISYFVSIPRLFEMMRHEPGEHWEAFVWAFGGTLVTYGNFAFFREQLCLIVCPYGRLQSAMTDEDSIIIGYDQARGEPRGRKGTEGAGACVDCRRCVTVCPTGIDIRNGLQLECIGCAACIDACDDVMKRLQRPLGLIRYDSLRGFATGAQRFLRPRVVLYAVLGVIGASVATFAVAAREPFEADLLRARGAPYIIENDVVRNTFALHLSNKASETVRFHVTADASGSLRVLIASPTVTLASLERREIPIIVTAERSSSPPSRLFRIRITGVRDGRETTRTVEAQLLGVGR